MILSSELENGLGNNAIHNLKDSGKYVHIALFCAAAIIFAGVAFVMGLPGGDTNGKDTYNVITRLSRTLTYTLSRTPGQPVLDYCNYVFRSFGGILAVQAWFVIVSALGITAFYC